MSRLPVLVHALPGLKIGGAERFLQRLLEAGMAKAYESHVVSMGPDGEMRQKFEAAGAHVHFLPESTVYSAPISTYRQIRAIAPDLVQSWMYHANLTLGIAKGLHLLEIPTFWTIRQSLPATSCDSLRTRAIIRAGALLTRFPEMIIYNSSLARQHHEAIGYSSERAMVIPNGFETHRRFSPGRAQYMRADLEIAEAAPVVIHVGRYHPVKDQKTLIQAALGVANQNAEAVFVFAGRNLIWQNAELTSDIPAELRSRFRFLGERDDVAQLLAMSDIFVLSSIAEAFPNALAEGMAAGLACVATDVGDVRQMLGDSGTIVAAGDVEVMAQALRAYLDAPDRRRADGARARRRIEDEYSLDAILGQYTDLYDKAIAQYRGV